MRPMTPSIVSLSSLSCFWSFWPSPLFTVFFVLAAAIPGLFLETQIAADTAVEVSREERLATGQEVDTTSGWSVEEIGVGLQARLRALGESVAQLQIAGSSMVAALWPEGVEPASMSRLARWLAAGGER
ncbi:hypothetical protein ZWY2020_013247 [Hordeum vulgare]|nr:hypothetical protein ZWY2020_013247 [Hordeum vulgare]